MLTRIARIRGNVRVWGMVALLLATVGCMDVTTDVYVRKDGSGTITETAYLSQMLVDMTQQMAESLGQETDGIPLFDEQKLRAKAPIMGEGVTFVSVGELTHDDGRPGYRVVYSFDDVRRLRLQGDPEAPAGAGRPAPTPPTEKSPITFDFTPGDAPSLTIHMPPPEPMTDGSETGAGAGGGMIPGGGPGQQPFDEEMARRVFGDFRIRIGLRVEGEIQKTNASFVNEKRDGITLMQMDIGELLEDPEQVERLQAVGQITDMETARRVLKGFKGIQIEPETDLTLTFK